MAVERRTSDGGYRDELRSMTDAQFEERLAKVAEAPTGHTARELRAVLTEAAARIFSLRGGEPQ